MPATKNNQYWKKRSKHGRDAIFTNANTLLAAAYEYFDWNSKNPWHKNEAIKSGEHAGEIVKIPTERPLTIEGLTQFLGVTKKYLSNFEKRLDNNDEDFLPVITHIREVISRHKIEGAIIGTFNANIVSRIEGLVDKSTLDIDFNKMSETDLDKIIERLENKEDNG